MDTKSRIEYIYIKKNPMYNINISLLRTQWRKRTQHTIKTLSRFCANGKDVHIVKHSMLETYRIYTKAIGKVFETEQSNEQSKKGRERE